MKSNENIPVVILAGGKGLRIQEETVDKPKALINVNGHPLIYCIMKHYVNYGFRNFIVLSGYKHTELKDYLHSVFKRYWELASNITVVYTGEETLTGGRILQIKDLIKEDTFMLTYCDGLSDVNLQNLLDTHKKHGKIGTVTAVNPQERFGLLKINEDNFVSSFDEKCTSINYINGGFFVFDKKILDYIKGDVMLEKEPMSNLVKDNELVAFKHNGFWKCVDTYKDLVELREFDWK